MNNLPLNWSTDYVTQTASVLKKDNYVILYDLTVRPSLKEYFLQKKGGRLLPFKFNSILIIKYINYLPFKRFPFITKTNEYINVILLKVLIKCISFIKGYSTSIVWTFDPRFFSFYKQFKNKNYTLIYDCVDFFSGSTLDPQESMWVNKQEKKLLRLADYVFTISYTLKRLHQKIRKNIYVVPQGFRLDTFAQKGNSTIFKNIPKNKPVIGYIGGINFRLDYELIYNVVSLYKNCTFVLAGPIQADTSYFVKHCKHSISKLKQLTNVYFIGEISKNNIPALISSFSVGIIPYNNEFTFNRYSYPMKLFEYFYLGKPVISSQIDELQRFNNYVFVARSQNEWIHLIQKLVQSQWPDSLKEKQKQIAIKNSWENKINSMQQHMTKSLNLE